MSLINSFQGSWILHLSIVLNEEVLYLHWHAFCVDQADFLFSRLHSLRLLPSPRLQSSSGRLSHQVTLFPSSLYIKISLWIGLYKVPFSQCHFNLNPMLTYSWTLSLKHPEISLHIICPPVHYTLRQRRICRYLIFTSLFSFSSSLWFSAKFPKLSVGSWRMKYVEQMGFENNLSPWTWEETNCMSLLMNLWTNAYLIFKNLYYLEYTSTNMKYLFY